MKYWNKIGVDIWEFSAEIRVIGGIWFGIRTIAIRLDSGDIWLHSPCDFSEAAIRELKTLGDVRYIIAPNAFHHLYVGKTSLAFPDAQTWCVPKVLKKQKNLIFSGVLDSKVPWAKEILTLPLDGLRMVEESVFFHDKSKSFICTDFVFNVHKFKNLRTKVLMTLIGANQKFAQGLEWRFLVKERALLSHNTNEILGWDFERIIMAHGEILDSENVHEQFANTTSWIRNGLDNRIGLHH